MGLMGLMWLNGLLWLTEVVEGWGYHGPGSGVGGRALPLQWRRHARLFTPVLRQWQNRRSPGSHAAMPILVCRA